MYSQVDVACVGSCTNVQQSQNVIMLPPWILPWRMVRRSVCVVKRAPSVLIIHSLLFDPVNDLRVALSGRGLRHSGLQINRLRLFW